MEISQINMMISQAKRSSNNQFQDAEFRLQQMARTSNRTQNEENTRIRMESSVTGNGNLLNITI